MSATHPKIQDRKFHLDVLWNVASLAILGVSGVMLNVVIARTVGAEALGVFNQVFAVYIVLSQLSVGGVHLSVLTYVARHPREPDKCASITVSALVLGAVLSSLWAAITWEIRAPLGRLFDSPGVADGLVLIAPGLIFFALNKILLNALNGAAAMRAYAIFQAARFLLILGSVLAIILLEIPGAPLAASLTIAEGILLPCLLLRVHFGLWRLKPSLLRRRWLREHLSFGARGLLSGALSEINTRVDILMLGFFTSDAVVGIYSVAAILAEGFGQLSIILRRNVDPLLGEHFANQDPLGIEEMARNLQRWFWPSMAALGLLAVGLYPMLLPLVVGGDDFGASSEVFVVLMLGAVINAGYRPFLGILLLAGKPGRQTLMIAVLTLANMLGNALLIPIWGMLGAAVASASVFVLEASLIRAAARRYCGVRL